ncbi:hypothetical protein D3C75_752850 [compost metagenome]
MNLFSRQMMQRKTDEVEKYNFCCGFFDNLTALQRGKVMSALNKKINYKILRIWYRDP